MKPLLEVKDLTVRFPIKQGLMSRTVGHVHAVEGVSFHVGEGETLGIVGESGCGKTTLGLATLRLIDLTAGTLFFDGEEITNLTRKEMMPVRRSLQTIFQDPYSSLHPRMTVADILMEPMRIHGGMGRDAMRARVAWILEKVGLSPEHGRRFPHEFSGGQRQRVGIARALVLEPRLIVADEPVSALDVSIQAQIINLMIDLQKEFDLSYLIIAHDLAVVEHICDRIIVMYLGRVIEEGSYRDIYTRPKHPYTRALLSAVPVIDPALRKTRTVLQGDVPSPINPPSGCAFHTRCPERIDACDKVVLELISVGDGHRVRCIRCAG